MYGYSFGNRVLQEVGWIMEETARQRGTVYRMEKGIFAFVTTTMGVQETAALYDAVRLKLQRGVNVDGTLVTLFANGAQLTVRGQQMDVEALYASLSYAYQVSRDRNQGELVDFNGSMNYDARASLEVVNTVRRCILEDCQGFSLKYQPIFNAETEQFAGVEALLRWEQEPYGEVLPLDFLPILEKDFAFEELGSWIFHTALSDGKKLLERNPDAIVSVNLSGAQIADEYFLETLLTALKVTRFPVKNLCLELTESCRLLEFAKLREMAETLRRHGIFVLIDNFGTGMNSLESLRQIPADMAKMNLSLVSGLEGGEGNILRRLIEIAAARGIAVCVKGVETAQMRDMVRQCGPHSLQGNYFAPPMTMAEIIEQYGK